MANETPQQINQLTDGFKNLKEAINSVNKEIPEFSDGIQAGLKAVAKELPNVVDSLIKLNAENRKLAAEGGKPQSILQQLASSMFSWNTVVSIGSTLLITYGGELAKWLSSLVKGESQITGITKAMRDAQAISESIIQTKLKGQKAAQSEITLLDGIYSATQKVAFAGVRQNQAVEILKEKWPAQFAALKNHEILAGKAANAYKSLREELIVISQIDAARDKITTNNNSLPAKQGVVDKERAKNKILENNLNSLKQANDASQINWEKDSFWEKLAKSSDAENSNLRTMPIALAEIAKKESDKLLAKTKEDIEQTINDTKAQQDFIDKNIQKYNAYVLSRADFNKSHNLKGEDNQHLNSLSTIPRAPKLTEPNLTEQAEKDTKDSHDRMAKLAMDAYTQELANTDDHYRQLEEKYNTFLDGYEKMSKAEQQKHKAEYHAVQTAQTQLESEHAGARLQVTEKFNKENAAKILQAQNELQNLKIKAMQEGEAKEIAQLQQQQTETAQQMDTADAETLERITKLYNSINDPDNAADKTALQKQLDDQYQILNISCQKREQLETQTAEAIRKIKQEEDHKKLTEKDQRAVDTAKSPAEKLIAQKQQINDTYAYEAQQAQGNSDKLEEIERKRVAAITALEHDAQQARKDFALQMAQKVSDTAFNMIRGGIQSQSEAKIKQLEKDKAKELSNTTLTTSQKKAIEDRYKQKEAQEKVKAFKAEQKAQIAQAIINGALAITKVTSQTGVLAPFVIPGIIAETVLQIATIAKQKPPQYAKGGYFKSDGRGALLPGYSRTDNTNAYLRSGEAVVVSEAMRNPWARNLVSAINVMHGGRDFSVSNPGRGYAIGGIFTDGGNANRYYSQPMQNQQDLANTLAYQMINNFPPIYVDVKDVNNQQNILAQTVNRVNL